MRINHIGPGLVEVDQDFLGAAPNDEPLPARKSLTVTPPPRDLATFDPCNDVAVLRVNPLLRHLDDTAMVQLVASGRWLAFERGDPISRQGNRVVDVLFIIRGRARAEISSARNLAFRVTVDFLGPGDDVGLLSLVDGSPHSASVVASEELWAIAIPFSNMKKYLERYPQWYSALAEIAVTRLRSSGSWLQSLI